MKRKLCDTELTEYEMTKVRKTAHLDIKGNLSDEVTDRDLRDVINDFVSIYDKLDVTDIPEKKPNYSYTELIYMAILTSPNFCLTTPEIYKQVQGKFAYFRQDTNAHWRNAIRHSLSKTKCFRKIKVGKRGSMGIYRRSFFLWSIHPPSLVSFARGDYRPCARNSETNTLRTGFYKVNSQDFWQSVADHLQGKIVNFQKTLELCSDPMALAKQQSCESHASYTGSIIIGPNHHLSATSCVLKPSPALPLRGKSLVVPAHMNLALESNAGSARIPEYDVDVDSDRSSPFSCNSNSGLSSCSNAENSDISGNDTLQDDSTTSLGLNISSLLGDDTLEELSDTSRSLCLDLTPSGEQYNVMYNPSLPASDYINRGVVVAPPVMCQELSTLENLWSICYNNMFYPSNPYLEYGCYHGYW